jgi:cytochrome P450
MFYCSGNRDESVFPQSERFDLTRPRTPHVGFGGGGIHYCLGNGVAKAQLRSLFSEILTKLPHMEVGEPENLVSEFINGVKHLPVRV